MRTGTVAWSSGFEVKDEMLQEVTYVRARAALREIDMATAQALLFTKYQDWQYEQETRIFTRLTDRDPTTGLYFADFDDNLSLCDVIAGPLCATAKVTIQEALGDQQASVTITKARLAFNTFRIVKNQQGFSQTKPII
jgi:hypothetical protein